MFSPYPEPRKAAVSVQVWSVNTLGSGKVPQVVVVPSFPEELTGTCCIDRSPLHQAGTKGSAAKIVLSQAGGVEDHGTM